MDVQVFKGEIPPSGKPFYAIDLFWGDKGHVYYYSFLEKPDLDHVMETFAQHLPRPPLKGVRERIEAELSRL